MVHEMIPGLHTPWYAFGIAVGIGVAFWLFAARFAHRATSSLPAVVCVGFAFVLASNLIHGVGNGLVNPQTGDRWNPGQMLPQYYHDAAEITSPGQFLRQFEQHQPQLTCHARTHPPGAVLLFYALRKTVGHPAIISLIIAALSIGLSAIFLHVILRSRFDRQTCGLTTLLFLLTPAVAIYYCASLDAVIAACFLGTVACFRHSKTSLAVVGTVICLFAASFLTFAATFLLPVLIGYELIVRRRPWRSLVVLVVVAGLYAVVDLLLGFNYLTALQTASALENPDGFRLFAEPVSYAFTRLENVVTIVFFFGPVLSLLFVRGLGNMRLDAAGRELLTLTVLGVATLLAMFLTGAFRTGETARACLFLYPLLMFPVAACLDRRGRGDGSRRNMLCWVFGQTLVMQTFGGYFW